MRKMLLLVLMVLPLAVFSQVKFEKGYFIDKKSGKTDCFIKNVGWSNNPTVFEYKLSQSDSVIVKNVSEINEFRIEGKVRYINVITEIEQSSDITEDLGLKDNPKLEKKEVLLRELIHGKASLYEFRTSLFMRYFFSVNDSVVMPLQYRRYIIKDNIIGEDLRYLGQLNYYVKCNNNGNYSGQSDIRYSRDELIRYFTKYNRCSGDTIQKVDGEVSKKNELNFKLSLGINQASFKINNPTWDDGYTDFGKPTLLSFGFETEYILPNWGRSTAFVFEPTYSSFKKKIDKKLYDAELNFKSLNIPVGLRYYIFIKEKRLLFASVLYDPGFGFNFNSKVKVEKLLTLDLKQEHNVIFGLGLMFNSFSAELRYHTDKPFTSNYVVWSSQHKNISLVIRYTFARLKI